MNKEFILGMFRFNIRIKSNTTRSKTRIALAMTRSKIRIVKRFSIQKGLTSPAVGTMVISSEMGEGRGCQQEGKVEQVPLAKGVPSRTRNSLWLSSSGLVT